MTFLACAIVGFVAFVLGVFAEMQFGDLLRGNVEQQLIDARRDLEVARRLCAQHEADLAYYRERLTDAEAELVLTRVGGGLKVAK